MVRDGRGKTGSAGANNTVQEKKVMDFASGILFMIRAWSSFAVAEVVEAILNLNSQPTTLQLTKCKCEILIADSNAKILKYVVRT